MFGIKRGLKGFKLRPRQEPPLVQDTEVEPPLELDYEIPSASDILKEYNNGGEKNITYPVKPPHQFANIVHDAAVGGIIYRAIEPTFENGGTEQLKQIKRLFNVDRNIDKETPGRYIERNVREIVDTYGIEVDDFQLEKIFYYLKRDFIGFGQIDLLMHDPYIEDVSCNGPELPITKNRCSFPTSVTTKQPPVNHKL